MAEALREGAIATETQKHTYLPDSAVLVDHEGIAAQVLKLYEALDANGDTLNVYSNFDISEEILTRLSA